MGSCELGFVLRVLMNLRRAYSVAPKNRNSFKSGRNGGVSLDNHHNTIGVLASTFAHCHNLVLNLELLSQNYADENPA